MHFTRVLPYKTAHVQHLVSRSFVILNLVAVLFNFLKEPRSSYAGSACNTQGGQDVLASASNTEHRQDVFQFAYVF